MSLAKKFCEVTKALWDLTLRRFPSKNHEIVWRDFEKILMYRSMMSQFSRIIHAVVYSSMGIIIWKQSEEYVATGQPENYELALKVFPYAKIAYILSIIGRVILIIL